MTVKKKKKNIILTWVFQKMTCPSPNCKVKGKPTDIHSEARERAS
jgi:hypothetical protein